MLPAVAIGAGLFLASASLAIDAGRAFVEQNHLQTTADAAALAATRRIVDTQAALAAALKVARANMPLERYGRVLDESDVEFGRWDSAAGTFEVGSEDRNAVRVTTRRAAASGNALPNFFAQAFGAATTDLEASAVGAMEPGFALCVLALHPSDKDALDIDGTGTFDADGCVAYANSSDADALHVRKDATALASKFCSVGGAKTEGTVLPHPAVGCASLPDPLQDLPTPAWNGVTCDHTDFEVSSGNVQIWPGVYCGGIEVKEDATATLMPGEYLLVDGPLKMKHDATITGSEVFVHLRGYGARLQIEDGANVDLSAPITGPYAGAVIYADRSQSGEEHTVVGTANLDIDGTLYLPTGRITYKGNSTAAITMLIAEKIKLNGNAGFQRHASSTNVPIPAGFATIDADERIWLVR